MNDRITLLATALLTAFFFVAGLLDILGKFLVKLILFTGFIGIVVNIIIVNSKDENQKNLPQ